MSLYTKDDLTRVNNDINGNPRYVIHFFALLTDKEKDHDYHSGSIDNRYNVAIARAKSSFGGKKFHNKQYGGGIVFQSYNTQVELDLINALHNEVE